MKKKTLALLLALVMVFALAACGSDSDSGGAATTPSDNAVTTTPDATPDDANEPAELTGEPIKIGHICDLTGAEALAGQEAKRSLEFAVEYLHGIAGRPVEIVVADALGTTDGAVDAARKMVEEDGVIAVFGPIQAGQKTAVAEYTKQAEVPLFMYSGAPAYLFYDNPWLIGVGGANPQMTVMADYVYNELGYRNVHILTMDNIGFKTFTDDFTTVFTALGGSIVSAQYAPFVGTDWVSYLSNMGPADAIMAWTTGSNAISLWQTWYDMGMNETLPIAGVMQSAFTEYYVLEALEDMDPAYAEAVLGTYSVCAYSYSVDSPENQAFVEAWQAEFGAVPATSLPGQVYESYQLLKAAIESIDGETESSALLDAIMACDITGPCGRLYFSGTGAAVRDVYIARCVRLEDGSYNNEIVKTYENVPFNGLLDD